MSSYYGIPTVRVGAGLRAPWRHDDVGQGGCARGRRQRPVARVRPEGEPARGSTALSLESFLAGSGKSLPPVDTFEFYVISSGRPGNVKEIEHLVGSTCVWVVGSGESQSYRNAGARSVIEGGGLCTSRNLALLSAATHGRICVQLSDDIQRCWLSC